MQFGQYVKSSKDIPDLIQVFKNPIIGSKMFAMLSVWVELGRVFDQRGYPIKQIPKTVGQGSGFSSSSEGSVNWQLKTFDKNANIKTSYSFD